MFGDCNYAHCLDMFISKINLKYIIAKVHKCECDVCSGETTLKCRYNKS